MSQTTYAWTIAAVLDVDEINGTLVESEELLDIDVELSSEVVTVENDYEELENKPKINNVTLTGNKSTSDLGIDIPTTLAELTGDSTHRVVTDAEKAVWSGKQDAIADLSSIRSGAALGATAVQPEAGKGLSENDYSSAEKAKVSAAYAAKHTHGNKAVLDAITEAPYTKPDGGIPASDMASAVQTSLGKADTALQEHQSLAAYRTAAQQDAIHDATKVNEPAGEGTSGQVLTTDGSGGRSWTTVQGGGEPAAYIKDAGVADEKLTLTKKDDTTVVLDVSGKADAEDIPTKTSDLTNDSGFLTEHQSLAEYRKAAAQDVIDATKIGDAPSDNKQYARKDGAWAEVQSGTADHTQLSNRDAANQHPISAITGLQSALDGKQGTVADLETIRSGAALGATALQSVPDTYRTAAAQDIIDAGKYTKPVSGIPESDLASGVTAKLNATKVTDVQMGGQSIVTNEVATIPTAEASALDVVTSLSAASTDSQIPTAKAVFDIVGDIESLLAAL